MSDNLNPYLAFIVGNRSVSFMVDTGTPFTVVTPKQVERLGLTDRVQPSEDDYYEGVVKTDLYAYPSLRIVAKDFCLRVREGFGNLLGMDLLTSTCSVLDLDEEEPRLYLHKMGKNIEDEYEMFAEVTVNGIRTEAALDTGYCGFFSTTSEEADELQLSLETLREPKIYDTQLGDGYVEHVARDVSMEMLGKEMKGEAEVGTDDEDPLIGMEFLVGSRIAFEENGNWVLTFPPESSEQT